MRALKCFDIFCSNRFFTAGGRGPEEFSLCESASASSKAVISCSFQTPSPNPEFLSANPTPENCPHSHPPSTPTPGPPAGVLPACASACYTPGLGTGRLYALCQQARGWALTNPHCPAREWWQRRRGGGASLSGFYSNPGTHTGLGGSKGCRGAYRAPSMGPKSIQT